MALLILGISALVLLAPFALRQWAAGRYADQIYREPAEVPAGTVAIVFGAGYWPSGRLSHALADRMETGRCYPRRLAAHNRRAPFVHGRG